MTSAWHNGATPQCVTRITNHITDMDTMPNRLRTRLVTSLTVTIPPHHMAVIPVTPSFHPICSINITTELIEVIENPLLYSEQPSFSVIDTLHRFYDRYQKKCITLTANVSDEELRINKGITICFTHAVDATKIHHDIELSQVMKLMTLILK